MLWGYMSPITTNSKQIEGRPKTGGSHQPAPPDTRPGEARHAKPVWDISGLLGASRLPRSVPASPAANDCVALWLRLAQPPHELQDW